MTVSPYASDAKISEALTAIGAELIGVTEQQLLQQILVAAATASGGGGSAVTSVNGQTGAVVLTKSSIGLDQVDNTSDANKPVSTATQTALNLKLNLAGGLMTNAICMPDQTGVAIGDMRSKGFVFGTSAAASATGIGGFANGLLFYSYSTLAAYLTSAELGLASTLTLGWGSSSAIAGKDTLLGRASAATLQMGKDHATVATAQCLKAHNVTTGTGGSLEIAGGTGSAGRGAVKLNGGGRVAYVDPPSGYDFSGSDSVSLGSLNSWQSQVNASISAITSALINHGLMAAS